MEGQGEGKVMAERAPGDEPRVLASRFSLLLTCYVTGPFAS